MTSSVEATGYGDDFGVYRQLVVEPVSMYQMRERLHVLTQNLGDGSFIDGLLLVLLCETSGEIEEARRIAETILAEKQYQQVVLAIPKQPAKMARILLEHQALTYLKTNEASLYAEGGELHEEWKVWELDKNTQLTDAISDICQSFALRADYFGEVLYSLRSRQDHMAFVKDHTIADGDLRDTRAVQRLACGYLKLLFPDIHPVTSEEFNEYCLKPAVELRSSIRRQMAIMDSEFSPNVAKIVVR